MEQTKNLVESFEYRETLSAKGVTFDGNNIDLDEAEIDEEELLEEMKVINDAKRDV